MTPNNAAFSVLFIVNYSDGSPYPLAGHTLQMDIKNAPGEEPVESFSTVNGGLVIVGNNTFMLEVDDDGMAAIEADRYWWDILDLTDATSSLFLGGGYWDIGVGITNSLTPSLPSLGISCEVSSFDGLTLTKMSPSIILSLQPQGPKGASGASVYKPYEEFGAIGNGIVDDSAAINDAWLWSSQNNGAAVGGSGTYLVLSQLFIQSNMTVFNWGAIFMVGFTSMGSNGFIGNFNQAVKTSDWEIHGGTYIGPAFVSSVGDVTMGSNVIQNVTSFEGLAVNDYLCSTLFKVLAPGSQIQALDPVHGTITLNNNAFQTQAAAPLLAATYGGNIFALYGDNWFLDNPTISNFAAGRGIVWNGDNNLVLNPRVIDPLPATGVGGIRYTGGNSCICLGGFVTSGDDALQITTVAGSGTHANLSTTGCFYIGCVGYSLSAHVFVAGLTDQNASGGQQTLTASIKGGGFIGVVGFGSGGRGGVIHNGNSSGAIEGLLVEGPVLLGDPNNTDVLLVNGEGTANAPCAIRDLRLKSCNILAPVQNGLVIQGQVFGVDFTGICEAPSTPGNQAVLLKGLQGGKFEGHVSGTSGVDVVLCTTDGNGDPCQNIVFEQLLVDGIPNGQYGVNFAAAINCFVGRGCVFLPAPGATTAGSISLGTGSTQCSAIGCDVSAMSAQGSGGYESVNVAVGHGHVVNSLYGDTTNIGSSITPVTILPNGNSPITPSAPFTPVLDNTALSADRGMTIHVAKVSDGCVLKLSRKGSSGGHNRNMLQDDGVTLIKAVPDNNFCEVTYSVTLGVWYESGFGAL